MPVAEAAASRRSFRDQSASLTSCIVSRSKTAGCRKGSTSANVSSPREARAAAIARSCSHGEGGHDQDLGAVGHERRLSGSDRRPAEVRQRG